MKNKKKTKIDETTVSGLAQETDNPESTNPFDSGANYEAVKKKTITGAVSYFGRSIFIALLGLVSTLVLSALLSAEDFGIYGIVIQIIAILVFFSDIGLAAALIQKKQEPSKKDFVTAFTLQQLLSWLIFAIILVLVMIGFVSRKTGPEGNWILLALGLSFPLATLKTIPSIILERKLEFSKLALPQVVEQIAFHTTLITCAFLGFGALSFVPSVILRSVSGVITIALLQRWPIGLGIDKASLKTLLGFGVQFQLYDFLARVKDNLFFLVLGNFLPLGQFGNIMWAKNWSLYPYNLTVQNVMALTFPTFSRLQHDMHLLKRAVEKSIYYISLVIFPILAGMCIFIYPLLEVFPVYSKWIPAAFSLIFFTLNIFGSAISNPVTNALNAIGKISVTLKFMTLWTILTWVITPLFMVWFGYHGVAIAAAVISVTAILPLIYIKRIVAIDFWDQLWRQLLAVSVMAIIGVYGQAYWSQNIIWLLSGMVITGISYLVILFAAGREKLIRELSTLRALKKA